MKVPRKVWLNLSSGASLRKYSKSGAKVPTSTAENTKRVL